MKVDKWIQFLSKDFLPSLATKDNKLAGKFHKINKDLSTVVFFVGNHLTIVDFAFYSALHAVVVRLSFLFTFDAKNQIE